jgi:hypothetical protein
MYCRCPSHGPFLAPCRQRVQSSHDKRRCPSDEPNADRYLLQGPLVGERQPSSAITHEYATADATYQTKTAVSVDIYMYVLVILTDVITAGSTAEVLSLPQAERRWQVWLAW